MLALAPYLNRLAALSMREMWEGGRYPRVAEWFERLRARPAFASAVLASGAGSAGEGNGRQRPQVPPEVQVMLEA